MVRGRSRTVQESLSRPSLRLVQAARNLEERCRVSLSRCTDRGGLASRDPNGAPTTVCTAAGSRVSISTSYSSGAFAIAFAKSHAIGVDIEAVRPLSFLYKLFERFGTCCCNPLQSCGTETLYDAETLLSWWTRAEAVAKLLRIPLIAALRELCPGRASDGFLGDLINTMPIRA